MTSACTDSTVQTVLEGRKVQDMHFAFVLPTICPVNLQATNGVVPVKIYIFFFSCIKNTGRLHEYKWNDT